MGLWSKLFGSSDQGNSDKREARAHSDASRFARLLVAEIKLNNQGKVYEGLQNADLYQRLKTEIDRSRKVYNQRVSKMVTAETDYFEQALVDTLADGDASKLGPEWAKASKMQ